MQRKISKHISYKEAVNSNTARRYGINNFPDINQLEAMNLVAEKIFEPVRVHFKKRIRVNSFFRINRLNRILKGSSKSQHVKGEAIDVDGLDGLTNKQIFDYIRENLDFDQLIWEFGTDEEPDWVHFSYKKKGTNRKQILRAFRKYGKTRYKAI